MSTSFSWCNHFRLCACVCAVGQDTPSTTAQSATPTAASILNTTAVQTVTRNLHHTVTLPPQRTVTATKPAAQPSVSTLRLTTASPPTTTPSGPG